MAIGTAGQLRFAFSDLAREIQILRDIARPFIAPRSAHVLYRLAEDLESLWSAAPNRDRSWELGDLWTVVSDGEYEPGDRRGARRVTACVSGSWDVRPMGTNPRKLIGRQKRFIEFRGIASTRVRLFDASNEAAPIAMWRMELGDNCSPGCYFHVQVLGDTDDPPFPSSVPVPRLPSIFVTPMGVIEFVLGEIFHDRWAKVAMESTGNVAQWSNLQRRRLTQLLDWQHATVKGSLMSPWMALKLAKPEPDMFRA